MHCTPAQIDRANAVSLKEFLSSQSEQLLKNRKNTDGKSFPEAVELLTGEHGEAPKTASLIQFRLSKTQQAAASGIFSDKFRFAYPMV